MIEKYGSGIQRIIYSFKNADLPEPIFENISDGFQVTVKDREKETVEETVEETVKKILEGMKNDAGITQRELMGITGLSRRGIEWNIAQLKKKGLIKRIGPTKGGYWEVSSNEK